MKANPKQDKEQFQRFKEAVKEFDADESGEALDRALKKLVPLKRPAQDS
jgi:hypothetical protein